MNLDINDFNNCVDRGLFLLNNRKKQMEGEGYIFSTCLKSPKWALEQRIINRERNTTMMTAVINFVEMIEEREESLNKETR
jgi:hypothetical protein